MPDDCLFCKILQGKIPARVIHTTDRLMIFEDIQPQAPIHWLLIHSAHTASVSDTHDHQLFADLMAGARDIAHTHNLQDYRLVFNTGEKAGQSVFHMHLHLLAGRDFTWPPG